MGIGQGAAGDHLEAISCAAALLRCLPAPGDDLERAAAFINPALLPENRFSAIFEVGKDVIGVGILIAARKEPLEIDIAPEKYATLNAQMKALIDGRRNGL
ncbi:hypothetical protein K7H91_06295 [Martelella mediterranea]|uniref:hypothetical protein n=1 Tax=Martelella mediterranea TaxID=293089 RepID=UPI001E2E173A|nr:hypothetical protein [Martelella mediterranea]MCD1633378.1 hypothetical protein [Martelella mediterranea]